MKCRICNAELQDRWGFCPYCGSNKVGLRGDSEEVLDALEESLRNIFGGNLLTDFPFGKGFMVEISQERGRPKVSVRELEGNFLKEEEKYERPIPKNSEVVEPKVSMREGGKTVEVFLPNVKSEGDISIKKFENSIEIRAFSDKKVYFAIIPIRFPYLTKQKFENNMLILNFS
ncbi:MAG: hypothetical protein ABH874_00360 [Methanobacteriota archaeon]